MAYSQKYALVHFIHPVNNGVQFHMADWLLHTTLADVFAIDRHSSGINAKLSLLLSNMQPAATSALNDSTLGTAQVVLLDKTTSLVNLHTSIVSLLEQNGAVFNNPEFANAGFLPHSTIQKSGRLHAGDAVIIDTISLVDMFPDGNWEQRRVIATFNLS